MSRLALPVNIICGYLGAGKTTLLNKILTQSKERILVMVNDFGEIAIDASLISQRSADTIQLNNGCICCAVGGGMFEAFERALSLRGKIDRLIIEASGVAEPKRLTSFAQAEPDLECRAVLTVVDPQTLSERLIDVRISDIVKNQIKGADAIYLSRHDISEKMKRLYASKSLMQINPLSSLHEHLDVDFFQALNSKHDGRIISSINPERNHSNIFSARSINISEKLEYNRILHIIEKYARSIHRIKGYIYIPDENIYHLLQLAGGNLNILKHSIPDYIQANQLVVISPDHDALNMLTLELQDIEYKNIDETQKYKKLQHYNVKT